MDRVRKKILRKQNDSYSQNKKATSEKSWTYNEEGREEVYIQRAYRASEKDKPIGTFRISLYF